MRHLIPTLTAILLTSIAACAQQQGLPADLAAGAAKATAELRAKAEKGDAISQWNLGFMFAKGQGVPKNEAESAKWFRKSAEQGFAAAQCDFGLLFLNGQGVAKNNAEAYKWFLLASRQGNPNAQTQIARLEPALTPAEHDEGQRLAAGFKPTKAR